MNMQLQRFGPEPAVAISEAAIENRNEALADAREVLEVSSPETQATATAALKVLKGIQKECEADRKELKGPVIQLGALVDSTVEEHVKPVIAEINRVSLLINGYQAAERRKLEAARAAQLEAELRIERERREAIEVSRRIQRQALLDAQKAEEFKRQAKSEAAQAFADELAASAHRQKLVADGQAELARIKANEQAERNRLEAAKTVAAAAPPRTEGLVVSDAWQFDVLDLHMVYAAQPKLVRLEPNRSAILEAIRGGMRKCQGLIIWSETKTTVRT